MNKPMLGVDDLILHMKSKGIAFTEMSEDDAKAYLHKNNNYFKLTSYRKNYAKCMQGSRTGQYEKLDFAYLVELVVSMYNCGKQFLECAWILSIF